MRIQNWVIVRGGNGHACTSYGSRLGDSAGAGHAAAELAHVNENPETSATDIIAATASEYSKGNEESGFAEKLSAVHHEMSRQEPNQAKLQVLLHDATVADPEFKKAGRSVLVEAIETAAAKKSLGEDAGSIFPIRQPPQAMPSGYVVHEDWTPRGDLTHQGKCLNRMRIIKKPSCYSVYKAEVHLGGPAAGDRTDNLKDHWWRECMEEGMKEAQLKEKEVANMNYSMRIQNWVIVRGGNGHACTSYGSRLGDSAGAGHAAAELAHVNENPETSATDIIAATASEYSKGNEESGFAEKLSAVHHEMSRQEPNQAKLQVLLDDATVADPEFKKAGRSVLVEAIKTAAAKKSLG